MAISSQNWHKLHGIAVMVHPKRQELLADQHAEFIRAFSEVCGALLPPMDCSQPIADDAACCRFPTLAPSQRSFFYLPSLPLLLLQNKESFEFYATEHFRMSGVYWGLTALHLLGRLDLLDREAVVAWVLACQRECGGFGGSERHDPHLLYTLSALQILALYDELHRVDADAVARCECAGGPGQRRRRWSRRGCTGFAVGPTLWFRLVFQPGPSPPLCLCRCGGPAAARRLLLGRCLGGDRHPLLLLRAVRAVAAGPPARH